MFQTFASEIHNCLQSMILLLFMTFLSICVKTSASLVESFIEYLAEQRAGSFTVIVRQPSSGVSLFGSIISLNIECFRENQTN